MDIEDVPVHVASASAPASTDAVAARIAAHLATLPTAVVRSDDLLSKEIMRACRAEKCMMTKRRIGVAYRQLCAEAGTAIRDDLRAALVQKAVRSASGIINISVVMPPDRFSCKYNCRFCPNETIANGAALDMPRSYLSNEDAVARARAHAFDPVRQTHGRFATLEANGHVLDKIEFRVLGGTFSCYDHAIADEFIRDLYYAANVYGLSAPLRPKQTLQEEQTLNETARIHVVGLGVETRPDEIRESEIVRFRVLGVTRVELGIQHTDDALLRIVNRGHGVRASRQAVKLLKDYGFKVELHIMTDLPGATPEGDRACYKEVLCGPDLIPDYMKDYPCLDVSFTEIKRWKETGKWTPYAEREGGRLLREVLLYRQSITPPWVRVNRIQRDFRPADRVADGLGYTSETHNGNLGDVVKREAEARGIYCQCIRCCEVKHESFAMEDVQYVTQRFEASGAVEYFLSAIVQRPHRPLLLGFLRLRISAALQQSILPELVGHTAMIRELHVYGTVRPTASAATTDSAQHRGFGKMLLAHAEEIARASKCDRIAVISGIGVREYYRKRGYALQGTYMVKCLAQIAALPRVYVGLAALVAALVTLLIAIYIARRVIHGQSSIC